MAQRLLFEIKKSEKYLSINVIKLHYYLTKENSNY